MNGTCFRIVKYTYPKCEGQWRGIPNLKNGPKSSNQREQQSNFAIGFATTQIGFFNYLFNGFRGVLL